VSDELTLSADDLTPLAVERAPVDAVVITPSGIPFFTISVAKGSRVKLVVTEGSTVEVLPDTGLSLAIVPPEESSRESNLRAGVSCNACGIVVRAARGVAEETKDGE